jgi:hypothetical protein
MHIIYLLFEICINNCDSKSQKLIPYAVETIKINKKKKNK